MREVRDVAFPHDHPVAFQSLRQVGMIGSLAAPRIMEERAERPILFDIAFSMSGTRD